MTKTLRLLAAVMAIPLLFKSQGGHDIKISLKACPDSTMYLVNMFLISNTWKTPVNTSRMGISGSGKKNTRQGHVRAGK